MATNAGEVGPRLEAGRRSLDAGKWEAARLAFEAVLEAEESAEAYESLGWATWWLGEQAAVFAALEHAYRLYRAAGHEVAAARVAIWLAVDHREFRGEVAIGLGWIERAEQLLANLPECPEHGWLALIQADFAQNVDRDMATTAALAHRAADLGRRLKAVDLETAGLALEGMSLVARGSFDVDRAAQWCDRMREIAERWSARQMIGVCRAAYGRAMATRGPRDDAEPEGTVSNFRSLRPGMDIVGPLRLAELRLRQGKAEEAREPFTRRRPAGLRYLERDRGESDTAARLAHRVLRAAADYESARTAYENAIDCLHETAAPYEEAIAPLGFARVLRADSRHQRGITEADAARVAFDRLGAGRDRARAESQLADAGTTTKSGRTYPLSRREIEVLRLIAAGMRDAEVAKQLTLSPHTVHRHVANIRTKLDLGSRAAAVAYATRAGLI